MQAEIIIGFESHGGKVVREQNVLIVSECHSMHYKEEADFHSIRYKGGSVPLP